MASSTPLRIGTRGSPLALAQAHEVRDRLVAAHGIDPVTIDIVVVEVTGDRIQDKALRSFGGKGLFTKEIEEALLASRIDLAVHSMKDVPTRHQSGLGLAAILEREDPRDAFVSRRFATLADMPAGTKIGTSSLRRAAQVRKARPDLEVVEFRGNVQTRMRKLDEGIADATFLAVAGLNRLDAADTITRAMPPDEMLPAVAQGAIGVEIRLDDARTRDLLAPLHHHESGMRVTAERAFLAELDGSCRTPIAGFAALDAGTMAFHGEVLLLDGSEQHAVEANAPVGDDDAAAKFGTKVGETLRERAGADFLAQIV
ncbi:MAG: hydroxymethylbilane synthase [Pseudomonadota bacterium]